MNGTIAAQAPRTSNSMPLARPRVRAIRHPRPLAHAKLGVFRLCRLVSGPADGCAVHAHAIIRVFCVDGPCQGLQHLDADTGRVLFNEEAERLGLWYIYRVSATHITHTDFGPSPNAHFDHAVLANKAVEQDGATDLE
jgi:hypothetical protein